MKRLIAGLVAIACLGVAGCATKPFDDYVATTSAQYENSNKLYVDEFSYSAMQTRGMRSDQIENTAIGNAYIGVSIAEIVRKATAAELKQAGMLPAFDADMVLVGDVTLFKAADLGFTIDWTYGITYTITSKSAGKTLFSRHYAPPMLTTGKLFMSQATAVGVMHKMIAEGCGMFIRDPEARAVLDVAP